MQALIHSTSQSGTENTIELDEFCSQSENPESKYDGKI